MSSPVKEGYLQRYKAGLIPNRWKSNFVVLYSDSSIVFFNNTGDGKPNETVYLKNVVQYTAVGSMCDRLPVRRPSFPLGVKGHAVNQWIFAIISTLTQPPLMPTLPQQTLRPIGWSLPIPTATSSSSNASVPAAANSAAGIGKPALAAGLKVASGLAAGAGKALSVSLQAFRFGYMLATLGGDA
uniref:PH domain-containing protein n=1 Tax=Meloidogyne javanica TaxID=6303 RepID=A0A915LCG0_MELJA